MLKINGGSILSIIVRIQLVSFGFLMITLCFGAPDQVVLTVDQIPRDGLVVSRVDLREASKWCGLALETNLVQIKKGSNTVPSQFVPDENHSGMGVILMQFSPGQTSAIVRLDVHGSIPTMTNRAHVVQTRWFAVKHDPRQLGGFPSEIVFSETRKKFDSLYWNDRLYHRQMGAYSLIYDRNPHVRIVSEGPLCTVVRVKGNYAQQGGKRPESQPGATYDWYYFHHQPVVCVRCMAAQKTAQLWQEAHFLELSFPTNRFAHWTGGEPVKAGNFKGEDNSFRFNRWGAIWEDNNGIAMLGAGPVGIYDGKGYGRYLHAHMDAAWREWKTTEFTRSAWLWIGTGNPSSNALPMLAETRSISSVVTASTQRTRERLAALELQYNNALGAERSLHGWRLALARLLDRQGRFAELLGSATLATPAEWKIIEAGDLRLIMEQKTNGVALLNLVDASRGCLLGGKESLPVFEITLQGNRTNEIRLTADRGWGNMHMEKQNQQWEIRWEKPLDERLGKLAVTARITTDSSAHRLSWDLQADGETAPWSLWQVRFPQISLSTDNFHAQLLIPQAAGVLKNIGREPMSPFSGDYPSGWMSMQLAAVIHPQVNSGLYFGLHDPWGSTKRFGADQMNESRSVRLYWDVPVPDMGRSENRFLLSGKGVWQVLRGDWYDAAKIYRDWVRQEAKWHPTMGPDGRMDTPMWMRELCAWAMTGGSSKECVSQVQEFARELGVPVGFHWYNWHQIPFDNDYPHYFPARSNFVGGVKQLQDARVYVMPYINGRLWDTHDRGANDFEFTKLALAAATKNSKGEVIKETYGSKETNGSPVQLAVMCPTTPLWQKTQHDIVMRLFNECGVNAVYMDQIAAAKPEWCFDATHAHPAGGGHWWNAQGYWPMLDRIRRDKPQDRMLTTECNAEPFVRWFDGYLTWHWQYNGQVPLFPAVYGGSVQMFGRAYGGGATKDLALRMKAGQQLLWGEQLGWIHPNIVHEKDNFSFYRDAVQLRWNLRKYFYKGQMARPPKLAGDIPEVTADWQWSGVWPVTTPALMGSAWLQPADSKIVLLFANVSTQAVTATVNYDLHESGLKGSSFTRRQKTPQGESPMKEVNSVIQEIATFPPRSVFAWEVEAKNR